MSSRYDEVAKAVAKNVPRRKLLKILAGGAVAAATGSALTGGASASGRQGPLNFVPPFSGLCEPDVNVTTVDVNGNFVDALTQFDCEVAIPWWNQLYQSFFGIFMNNNPV
jgi:hypothetical protein